MAGLGEYSPRHFDGAGLGFFLFSFLFLFYFFRSLISPPYRPTEKKKRTLRPEEHETRTADHCETGKDCCSLRILEAQLDFANEISLPERMAREADVPSETSPRAQLHRALFIGQHAVKRYTQGNCSYSFGLESAVLAALDSVSLVRVYSPICDGK